MNLLGNKQLEKGRHQIIIDEALRYLSLGFSVIPLGSITKDATGRKVIEYPKDGWKKYQESIAKREDVLSWDCENLGIATGKVSGVLVLDIDSYKKNYNKDLRVSLGLTITAMQRTASGGEQLFYKIPDGLVIKNAVCIGTVDSGIDIRGDGGMVIIAPSATPYGSYEWVVSPFDEPIADIPPRLLELLVREGASSEFKVKKALPELIGLKEGEGRNNAMASLIGSLLLRTDQDNWDEQVLLVAEQVNNTYLPPMSRGELLGIYNSIAKKEIERRNKVSMQNNKSVKTDISKFTPALTHAELILKEFPPARYTLDPFFEQGTMNMVSAPPNTWKSWLLFLFAGHIVNGTSVFNKFDTEKTNVMIVNEEDSARLIQDRLRLLNIKDVALPIYYRIAQGSKLKEEFINNIIQEAKSKNIGVIMFDSLRSIHEADENDSTSMQGVMDLLKKIARENITVIFTHHHRKKSQFSKNDDAESSRGSSAINASISGHISLEEVDKDGEKYLILKHLKSKVGEKLEPIDIEIKVELNKSVNFQYLGEHKPKEQALTEAKTRILNELKDKEELLSRKDFVRLKVGGDTTVKMATKSLETDGKVKAILRKKAEKIGLHTLSQGKSNEILYYLKKEGSDLNLYDLPDNLDQGMFQNVQSEDT